MEGLFLFKLNPVLLDVSVLGPKLRGWSLDDPDADPRPDDWDDLGKCYKTFFVLYLRFFNKLESLQWVKTNPSNICFFPTGIHFYRT